MDEFLRPDVAPALDRTATALPEPAIAPFFSGGLSLGLRSDALFGAAFIRREATVTEVSAMTSPPLPIWRLRAEA